LCENIPDVRVLIAPDKFKGSLSAREVAENIATGLRAVLPDAAIEKLPVADGGEGTVEAIHASSGGEWVICAARDALGRPIEPRYLWLGDRATAVMEMSEAAGLWRIAPAERDLLRADTYGVGEMMRDAASRGAKEILIGLGGSATNDGGLGMARALGLRFFGTEEQPELENPSALVQLKRIVPGEGSQNLTALSRQESGAPQPSFPRVVAAVDVRNPLLGSRGATRTFGPQKGGTPEQLEILERALARLADVVARDLGCDFRETPGAGAAGGLGFGLMSFCGASVRPGFEVVAEVVGLKAAIERADVVITGEGRLDEQTLEGKVPAGVARLARELGKPVFAIVGASSKAPAVRSLFDGLYVLARGPVTTEDAITRAGELLRERARELAQMI
jgi:glycerate 2-kinase